MHEPAPLEGYLNRLNGEVFADEQQGPFCQLCLQRGHPLVRCPLREGLMFLGHVSMMLQLPNETERISTPWENTNYRPDWRRRRRWLNASRRRRERITRRRDNTYNHASRGNYTVVQSMPPPPPPPNTRAISMAGNASVITVGSSSSSILYSTYSSTSDSTIADENHANPSGDHSFRAEPAGCSQAASDGLPLRLSNETSLPANSNNGELVNDNILAEIASVDHPGREYVAHWDSTAQVDTVMTGAVGAVVEDHGDGVYDII
ncbi:hypothetical protein IFM53868_01035 [Aspergillus udagawae]|uniref:Uncharacterized protein n=1 Tax=Aspergillus udagawae TaxID=91492 RepID=A0ABQ1A4F8_9EURO|nr:hypothetical protein IFM53868_01035 [Aspergillus udagawae]GFG15977.1 hypothetical protein IFM5058_07727 [Aspergillus udagawae]